MKKTKTKESNIEKKLNRISLECEKLKNKSLTLWTEVKKWNEKNDNKLRPFEDVLLSRLISDLRVIQNEHMSKLKVLVRDVE